MVKKLIFYKQQLNKFLFSRPLHALDQEMRAALVEGHVGKARLLFVIHELLNLRIFRNKLIVARLLDLRDTEEAFKRKLAPAEGGFSYRPNRHMGSREAQQLKVVHPEVFYVVLDEHSVKVDATVFYNPKHKKVFISGVHHPHQHLLNQTNTVLVANSAKTAFISLPKKEAYLEKGIFFGGNGTSNYYHFLVEILCKAMYLHKLAAEFADYPVLLSEEVAGKKNLQELVAVFLSAYKRELVYLPIDTTYQVKKLIFISSPVESPFIGVNKNVFYRSDYVLSRPEAIHYLRRTVLQRLHHHTEVLKASVSQSRIFLARRFAKGANRHYNQEEIFAVLQAYGFSMVYLEDYAILEQASLINAADVIVGPTGAAWTNLLFAKPGAIGICWMHESFGDFAGFSNIAAAVGVHLFYLDYASRGGRMADAYYLSPSKVENMLRKVLNTDHSVQ